MSPDAVSNAGERMTASRPGPPATPFATMIASVRPMATNMMRRTAGGGASEGGTFRAWFWRAGRSGSVPCVGRGRVADEAGVGGRRRPGGRGLGVRGMQD